MSSRLSLAMSATALVVALLGSTPLGHALASQLPSNSVGPLQIKRNAVGPAKVAPNAIRTGHVLDGSLLTADFKPGQIPQGQKGDKGEKGDKGDKGAKGDKGDAGPPGLSERAVVSAMSGINSESSRLVQATCPAGKVAVGGGGVAVPVITGSNAPIAVTRTSPFGPTGWIVTAQEMSAFGGNWWIQAHVVCAKVAP